MVLEEHVLGVEVNGELPFKGGIGILDGGPHPDLKILHFKSVEKR